MGITKRALRKALGRNIWNHAELSTIIMEVEAVVNSRPLCYVDDDINSGKVITPSHFTSLNNKTGYPEILEQYNKDDNLKETLVNGWRKGQYFLNVFLRSWLLGYLPALRVRILNEMKRVRSS